MAEAKEDSYHIEIFRDRDPRKLVNMVDTWFEENKETIDKASKIERQLVTYTDPGQSGGGSAVGFAVMVSWYGGDCKRGGSNGIQ